MAHERALTAAQTAELACAMEMLCPKPGNVSPGRPFRYINDLSFITSAMGLGDAFRDTGASVGRLVDRASAVTKKFVDRNTNLGIILLLAPLVRAAHDARTGPTLREEVRNVLSELNEEDSRSIYAAIRSASPEGLGKSGEYDVSGEDIPPVLEAMRLASAWDSVALEYAEGYGITFELTSPCIESLWAEGHTLKTSIGQTFLVLLSEVPDTLIARKAGRGASKSASRKALSAVRFGGYLTSRGREAVLELSSLLEDPDNLMNPGTTADLIAAGLFVFLERELAKTPLPAIIDRWDLRADAEFGSSCP